MERTLPAQRDFPLHGVAASRLIEQEAQIGLAPHALMRRAGSAVAALARALHPHAHTVWIACGPGNNGGDGLDAAIHLHATGLQVRVTLAAEPAQLPPDARDALDRAIAAGITISRDAALPEAPDLAIDALLGLGGNRAPSDELARWIARLNALACPVLAVDLPSGLNADTGQAYAQAHPIPCVQATHTLSLLTLKPGLYTGSGRDFAGDVWFDDLGIAAPTTAPIAMLSGANQSDTRPRLHGQHKGSFGDVCVVGGASGMVGAALLAGRAAHAAGAGRVFVALLDDTGIPLDPQRPDLMLRRDWWRHSPAATLAAATVTCGCGGGTAVREALPRLLSCAGRLVLDADALNAIAGDESLATLLIARRSQGRDTVLTPHPLEAARLLRTTTNAVQQDRLAAAQQLAERLACVVLLKGSGSVIAEAGRPPWINPTGNAALATAGTGDVLAGWIAGAWSALALNAGQAARHAAWLHGRAADLCGHTPLRAADLIEAMHQASQR